MTEAKCWYVAKTRAKQERAIYLKLTNLGIESYVPIRTELRNWHDRKKKVDVVLIPNTIFIRTQKSIAFDLHNLHGIQVSYLRNMADKNMLMVIPDYQMENFQRFINATNGVYNVESDVFAKGDRVIIKSGQLKGIIGELIDVSVSHSKFLIKLDTLLACSVTLSPDDVEKLV
ncbi:MAG: UpxY family transcription antiterminator [Paludibacteraceae bacterium]|nr:UpxY family transcription antiterminator [Paludibacteraceae bacterium]MCQ2218225.1 UpxY family transcription antiterminator [Paludibacteraceae bacterium]